MSKLAQAYAMSKRKKMAMGGEVPKAELHHDDLVDRIMEKRSMPMADDMSADFEATPEASEIESTNSGGADGDFMGNESEEQDRRDIVGKIMHSLAKKDRLPSPA